MSRRLVMIRHGRTGFSGRYVGSSDVELSPEGIRQMKNLRFVMNKQRPDTILSSPMLRCRQSSEILFSETNVSYKNKLREVDFGSWERLTFQEIVEKDPDLVDSWSRHPLHFCFPNGESVKHFIDRIRRVGESIQKSSETDIIVVSHGGVIRNLLCYFLKLDYSNALLFQVQKGRFSTLELFDTGAVLTGLNLGADLE